MIIDRCGPGRSRRLVRSGSDRHRDVAARVSRVASLRRRRPRPRRYDTGDSVVAAPALGRSNPDDDDRGIQLQSARQLRRSTWRRDSAQHWQTKSSPRRSWNGRGHQETIRSKRKPTPMSRRRLRIHSTEWPRQLPDDVDVSTVVHQSTSIPTGLMELVSAHDANLVVVGSSSSGLLGRVTPWAVSPSGLSIPLWFPSRSRRAATPSEPFRYAG